MLSTNERNGLREIVQALSLEDVLQLCETVSCRKVVAETQAEAIEIILRYSESAKELLGRKKIHAAYIFNYLHSNNVDVPVKSEKKKLIRKAVEFWNGGTIVPYDQNDENDDYDVEDEEMVTTTVEMPSPALSAQPAVDPTTSQMAIVFTQWFYRLLNSSTGDFTAQQSDTFGPQHFWEDSILCLISNQCSAPVSYSGSRSVALSLSDLVTKMCLKFDPDTGHGVKAMNDAHGLVKVMAAGVVYNKFLHPCGLFDQGFGLVKEFGSESTWKIKFTELKLQIKDCSNSLQFGTVTPSLTLTQAGY